MVKEKSWNEFRESGLLWFINSILHTFGWAICCSFKDGEIVRAYPARVKFRGFSEDSNSDGYTKITNYLKDNIDELVKETIDD